jgi:peptide subunit release factor 1 (eRF1)
MLDELLGRAELKARIEELEDEVESLEAQLEAESDRRAEAVRDKQAAEERVNELEDRITELEDRVERASGDETGPEFRARVDLRGDRRERVLDLLGSIETTEEGMLTAYVPDDPSEAVREAFGDRAPLVSRATPCLAVRDQEGVVAATLRPPNPPEQFATWSDRVEFDRSWLAPTGRYALAVVRADLFALGVYEVGSGEVGSGEVGSGEVGSGDGDRGDADGIEDRVERVHFEGFESDVKGKHSKGGFSQDRFERRRESQIREHLDDCQAALADLDADRLFVVGEGTLLDEFDADATAAVDATGKPEAALEDAHEDFWTVSLSLF